MLKPWPKIGSRPSGNFRIFNIRTDTKASPRTGHPHDFYVIDTVDWVNVIALTPDAHVVMVEQYRHGSDSIELEIPGGMVDPEDSSALVAGVRELREETGYEGSEAVVIGQVYPNPAIMNNRCFTVLVRQCHSRHQTTLDPCEDLITRLVPVSELGSLVAAGKIRHSLVVAAIYHFELWQRRAQADGNA